MTGRRDALLGDPPGDDLDAWRRWTAAGGFDLDQRKSRVRPHRDRGRWSLCTAYIAPRLRNGALTPARGPVPPLNRRAVMADLIFLVLGTGLFAAFAAFTAALRRL
uniref:Uncharacterized protein n=1 Tax=Caulobacter sp. (strain K31) TaxID=366602 RepID=B0SYJ8_CAUSK